MRVERLGLELGVELDADIPGMGRQLDDLGQNAVGRQAGEAVFGSLATITSAASSRSR